MKKSSIPILSPTGSNKLVYVKIFSPKSKLFEPENETSSCINAKRHLLCSVSVTNRL
jgi:hypothetical protein